MFLKELTKKEYITITYYENSSLLTCNGRVCLIDIQKQALLLEDRQQKNLSIRLSDIRKIH
ncbi:YolD-like family protein [Bacillus sp. X1(2014)]|uniref:YolD-like family protein n=1 Tax=Bacillus sp. X1(2014) TaxID=1565991 RepID=UPI0011A6C724|nr:YolD-like family protein [Bacillus sp. X1(2014)]